MLEYLKGRLKQVGRGEVVLEVGGAEILIRIPTSSRYAKRLGQLVTVYTVLDIQVRRWTVYGFGSPKERKSFEELWKIPGIGAATALKLLPHRNALRDGRPAVLPELPGVGPAKRKRLLRWFRRGQGEEGANHEAVRELRAALKALGLHPKEAQAQAVRTLARNPGVSLEQLVRLAVKR